MKRASFVHERVSVTAHAGIPGRRPVNKVEYMDVSPKQIVGVTAALIPFLEHDGRQPALMGFEYATPVRPLIQPEAPLVGTGIEAQVAIDSGQVIVTQEPGRGKSAVTGDCVRGARGEWPARPTSCGACQRFQSEHLLGPTSPCGQRPAGLEARDVLADSSLYPEWRTGFGPKMSLSLL